MKSFGRMVVVGLIVAIVSGVLHQGRGTTHQQAVHHQQAVPMAITTRDLSLALRAYIEQIRPGLTLCMEGSIVLGQAIKGGGVSPAGIAAGANRLTGPCDTAGATLDGTAIPAVLASSRTFRLYTILDRDGLVLVDQAMHEFATVDPDTSDMGGLSRGASEYGQAGVKLERSSALFAKMQHDWHVTIPTVTG